QLSIFHVPIDPALEGEAEAGRKAQRVGHEKTSAFSPVGQRLSRYLYICQAGPFMDDLAFTRVTTSSGVRLRGRLRPAHFRASRRYARISGRSNSDRFFRPIWRHVFPVPCKTRSASFKSAPRWNPRFTCLVSTLIAQTLSLITLSVAP